ncbi:MAG TPA: methyltransferase domain-containing protein [Tepidiformaceae bacterium]|nr:methyltransferase domain-containing protein [Tepidiformaceae bacterium]
MLAQSQIAGAAAMSMQSTSQVQKQFGPVAEAYATFSYHANGPDLAMICEAANFTGTEFVVDMGSGAGHTALACARHAGRVVGIDVTPEMVLMAAHLAEQRGLSNVEFRVGDVEALPFEDGTVDVVTSRVSAHHYADVPKVLEEAHRVLRPGGTLLVVDTVSPEDPASDTFLNCIEYLRDPSHARNYKGSEWLRMLAAAGFEPAMLERFPLALDGADWAKRQQCPPEKVAVLRQLFREATSATRAAFDVRDEPWGFSIPIALMRGVKAG